jgi:hypothetical protein
MRRVLLALTALPLAAALLSGCFVTGPGPMATYAIQAQPAPGSCHYTYVGTFPLPDPHCTPGAISPEVTQSNIGSTICSSGYTSSIRPPESITEPEKEANAVSYGYTGSFSTAEYDHLIPLELGGDPNAPQNLWVEPNDNPNAMSVNNSKDELENVLNDMVCAGQITLFNAQFAISSNWVTAYQTYVGPLPVFSPAPPSSGPWCTASASPSNDGYPGDYEVYVHSNQPDTRATASDANDTWSDDTDSSGYVAIWLYDTSPGEQITVTVGPATCTTTA